MANEKASSTILVLGGIVTAAAVLTLGVGVFLQFAEPVLVTLNCDRASGQCVRTQSKITVPIAALATARQESRDDGQRMVVDTGGEPIALSAVTRDEKRLATQATAIAQMRAFASSPDATLSVSYPAGGGPPPTGFWGAALLGLVWGVVFVVRGLRARKLGV